jgi:hypothetical protein
MMMMMMMMMMMPAHPYPAFNLMQSKHNVSIKSGSVFVEFSPNFSLNRIKAFFLASAE